MALNDPPLVCGIEPFIYQSTPQTTGDEGASSNQINEQALQDWTSRVLTALCSDLQQITEEIKDLDTRVTALETP